MVLFQSMQTVTLWTIATAIILVWFGLWKQPFATTRAIIFSLWTSRFFLIFFTTMVLPFIINEVELRLEKMLYIDWDFTANIHQLEGQFVHNVQQMFDHPFITQFVSFFYTIVFQALIIASFGIYVYNGEIYIARAMCCAVIINYLVAIPFYLFFPVNEVWSYPPASAHFRMLDVFPNFEAQYRALSGINNCFPSLHTSISITIALLALRSGNKRWAFFTAASAAIIVFSIFYLGIHWFMDMIAGTILALFASWASLKLVDAQCR